MTPDPASVLLVHVTTSVVTIAIALALGFLLRERPEARHAPDLPYEGGIRPTGDAPGRAGAPYFLVAAFFLVFDVEVAILFAWAIAAREAGVPGLIGAAIFIAVPLAALV